MGIALGIQLKLFYPVKEIEKQFSVILWNK